MMHTAGAIAAWSTATFVAAALAVWGFLRVSRRRLVDAPGARSSHVNPTPTGGGFPAVFAWLGTTSAAVAVGVLSMSTLWTVAVVSAVILAVLGLADDALDLPRIVRYGTHVVVGITVAAAVGFLPWPLWAPAPLRAAVSVVLVTALINAFNFMDGIDALVGGSGTIATAWLAAWTGEPIWWMLAAAFAGFQIFNLPPARIFMGDSGSTTLGGLVGIAFAGSGGRLSLGCAIILAPLMGDAVYTLTRRALRGENIFRAHHSHLYQRLLRAGHHHGPISASYALATCVCGAAATWARPWGPPAALLACGLAIVAIERHVAARGVPFTRPPH